MQLTAALKHANKTRWNALLNRIDSQELDNPQMDHWVKYLGEKSWEKRFVARHVCVRLGGAAIMGLIQREKVDSRLLMSYIAEETARRLRPTKERQFLCGRCLARILRQKAKIGGKRSTDLWFYGCRLCAQGHNVLAYWGHVVAVLDPNMNGKIEERGGDVRVNWLEYRKPSDFDRVEIVQASESEIEQFVIHVRNDADDYRRKQCGSTICRVHSQCQLSENLRRALERTFQRVTSG